MDITYFGQSSFKLRGKTGSVVMDPFAPTIGFEFPKTSADIVTVSHHHFDHDYVKGVSGTTRRPDPFLIDTPGEFELMGVSVFTYPSFHDNEGGKERGANLLTVVHMDGLSVVHLGDLGHGLSDKQLEIVGIADVLLVPVGGGFTIGPKEASSIVEAVDPYIAIPMHYKTPRHAKQIEDFLGVDAFLKEMGKEGLEPKDKLTISAGSLPEEMEIVVLK